jgi:hypothetical protein
MHPPLHEVRPAPSTCRRSGRSKWVALALVLILAVVALTSAPPAAAAYTNSYATAYHVDAFPYWGVGVEREDVSIAIPHDGSCSATYTGTMARQIETVVLSGSNNGVQLMTVHKCNGVTFWLAGYNYSGGWYPLALIDGPPGQTHSFFIHRAGYTHPWTFQIDQTVLAQLPWAVLGTSVHVGLHTWTDQAVAASHTYRSLVRLQGSGGWIGWQTPVYGNVHTPLVCGGFWGPTIWRASVNAPC